MAEFDRLLAAYKAAGVTRVHIDVLDDTLVTGRTIGAADLIGKELGIEIDVHLMTAKPDFDIAAWTSIQETKRIIAHVESEADWDELLIGRASHGRHLWAAINPDTSLEHIEGLPRAIDGVMCMTVVPGAQGRPFRSDVLEKIRTLNAQRSTLPVMVDGGITPDTAPQCVAAGAAHVVCGSYLARASDIPVALARLRAALSE